MSDLTVILDRKELVVRMESKSIRVDRPDGPPERIPLGMVARVILTCTGHTRTVETGSGRVCSYIA